MTAVIITGNKYPMEDAGAIRQHATAKILRELGYDVLVLGYGNPTGKTKRCFDDVNYLSFRPSAKSKTVRAFYRYFFINRVVRYIRRHVESIDVLLVVDVLPKDFKRVKRIASEFDAILVHDSVEWYSPEEFTDGVRNRSYINKEYTNTKGVGKGWRVIAISHYLHRHFQNKCDKVAYVPVIMDMSSIKPCLHSDNKKIVFVYAGGPGRKDYLATIIQGFSMLSESDSKRVELNIYGVNKDQLIKQCGVQEELIDELGNVLHIHGRVPHDKAATAVKNASFSILIRDETLRYAIAGFPTKVVESLAYGTPVLCNYSSDLKDYLFDKKNAIISRGHSAENVCQAVQSALNISSSEYNNMRANARETAETFFDYHHYCETISNLIMREEQIEKQEKNI